MNKPKQIGTRAETAVVRYLRENGWPAAERRALRGAADAGDVAGTPGIVWEVKGGEAARAASDQTVTGWLAEAEIERLNAQADLGVLVLQRRGVGPTNAGRWWAVTTLATLSELTAVMVDAATYHAPTAPVRLLLRDLVRLLRATGYGTPPHNDTDHRPTPQQAAPAAGRLS